MEPITLFITIIFFIYCTIFFIHILWKSRKIDWAVKYYYFGIAMYIILFVISQSMFVINEMLYTGSSGVPQQYYFLYILANFIGQMAIFGIIVVVEKYVYNKFHYIPSAITLISAVLILVLPRINDTSLMIYYILIAAFVGALIPFIYFRTGFQVSGKPRNKSFIIGCGLIIFILGVLLNTYFLLELIPILAIIAPIVQFVGIIIFHYGFLIYYELVE
ncbi:MAG: hypothetical protein ACFFAO_05655 [Candidatus Hermodarchaeota archaeon]